MPVSYSTDEEDRKYFGNSQDYQHMFTVIMKVSHFEVNTVWHYMSMALSCLRFDTRNLPVREKHQIAQKINILLSAFRRNSL